MGGIIAGVIITAAVFSRHLVVKIICWAYIGLIVGGYSIAVIFGETPKEALVFPVVYATLVFLTMEVKRSFGPNEDVKKHE